MRGRWQCGRVVVPAVGVEPTPPALKAACSADRARPANVAEIRWLDSNQRYHVQSVGSTVGRHRGIQEEGLEPSRTASKTVGLPLADSRGAVVAGVEPAWGRFNRALPYR